MTSATGLPAVFVAAALAAGCGPADDATFANRVAAEYRADCDTPEQLAQAPSKAMGAHLVRLCACSEAKIAATPIRRGESEDSINAKIHAAMDACSEELGGAPGEGQGGTSATKASAGTTVAEKGSA